MSDGIRGLSLLPFLERKNRDNAGFVKLGRATDKLASFLKKCLSGHLEVLKSHFIARALLGSCVQSASMEDVPVSDKAFAHLQERYAALFQYSLAIPGEAKPIVVSASLLIAP